MTDVLRTPHELETLKMAKGRIPFDDEKRYREKFRPQIPQVRLPREDGWIAYDIVWDWIESDELEASKMLTLAVQLLDELTREDTRLLHHYFEFTQPQQMMLQQMLMPQVQMQFQFDEPDTTAPEPVARERSEDEILDDVPDFGLPDDDDEDW